MALFASSKDLQAAQEKIAALETKLAEIAGTASKSAEIEAQFAALNTEVGTVKAALEKANTDHAAEVAALMAKIDATEKSVTSRASHQAAQIVGGQAAPPVPANPAVASDDFLVRMAEEKDPVKRSQIWAENKKNVRGAFIKSKQN